jgi:predicted RNase H-like HicB family nuclease/uncharacterized damage-inducible protein DinB
MEIGPDGSGAFVPECPGCWVFGRNPERALDKVRNAVTEHFNWLSRHGESAPVRPAEIEVEVAEVLKVDYDPVKAGKPEPLFWSEVPRVKKDDIMRTIRLMAYSRDDLLSLVSNLDRQTLNWKPPNEPRTIRNCLKHIAYVEPWYITRLNMKVSWTFPRNIFEMLKATRKVAIDSLRTLPREKRGGIIQPEEDLSSICNLWTARKVLRRLVDHEVLHTKYIEKVLRLYKAK